MPKFEYPSKLQGISEQSDVKANILTAKDIQDLYPDETVGLVRSTPIKRLHTILNAPAAKRHDFISPITGNATRLTITASTITILDLVTGTNVPCTVNASCLTYLNTVGEIFYRDTGDSLTIVNKGVKVLETLTNPTVEAQPPLIFFKAITPAVNYSIQKSSGSSRVTVAGYTTHSGGTTYQNQVAEELATQLVTNEGWTVDVVDGVMRVVTDGEDIFINSSNDRHLQDVVLIKGQTKLLSDVPSVGFDGYTIEITGTVSDSARQFIKFKADTNGVTGAGSWVESVKPQDETTFNPVTIPVSVIPSETTNSFEIKPIPLSGRKVGDSELNPSPSFVNSYIRDVEEHKSRLGILSTRGVSLSDSGDAFNFYRSTISTLDDSQRIDLNIPTKTLAETGEYLVSFQDDLLIFTGSSYISVYSSADGILKPDDATTSRQGTLQTSKFVKPTVGANAVFALATGESQVNLYEIFRRDIGLYDLSNTSTATPSLINKGANSMVSTANYSSVYIVHKENEIIVHKYLIEGGEKVQQAFVRRTTPFDVIDNILQDDLNSRIILSGYIGDDYVTSSFSLDVKSTLHDDVTFNVYLDDQIVLDNPVLYTDPVSFNTKHRYTRPPELTDEWLDTNYFSIGYKLGTGLVEDIDITYDESYVYSVRTTDNIILGREYDSFIQPHEIYAPSEQQESKNPNPVLIKQLVVQVVDSSALTLNVTNKQTGAQRVDVKSGIRLQQTTAQLGTITPEDRFYRFTRLGYSKNTDIKLKSNIWLPLTILSMYIDAEVYSVNNVFVY
jgi:hypothetical protein